MSHPRNKPTPAQRRKLKKNQLKLNRSLWPAPTQVYVEIRNSGRVPNHADYRKILNSDVRTENLGSVKTRYGRLNQIPGPFDDVDPAKLEEYHRDVSKLCRHFVSKPLNSSPTMEEYREWAEGTMFDFRGVKVAWKKYVAGSDLFIRDKHLNYQDVDDMDVEAEVVHGDVIPARPRLVNQESDQEIDQDTGANNLDYQDVQEAGEEPDRYSRRSPANGSPNGNRLNMEYDDNDWDPDAMRDVTDDFGATTFTNWEEVSFVEDKETGLGTSVLRDNTTGVLQMNMTINSSVEKPGRFGLRIAKDFETLEAMELLDPKYCLLIKTEGDDNIWIVAVNMIFATRWTVEEIQRHPQRNNPNSTMNELFLLFEGISNSVQGLRQSLQKMFPDEPEDASQALAQVLEKLMVESGRDFLELAFNETTRTVCSKDQDYEPPTNCILPFSRLSKCGDQRNVTFHECHQNTWKETKVKCSYCGGEASKSRKVTAAAGRHIVLVDDQSSWRFSNWKVTDSVEMYGGKWDLVAFAEHVPGKEGETAQYRSWMKVNELVTNSPWSCVDGDEESPRIPAESIQLEEYNVSILVFSIIQNFD